MSNEKDTIITAMDTIVDTYQSQDHPLPVLIELRRNLAIWLYRLTAHVKQTYGTAGLKYAQRKYRIAQHIVDARAVDAKAAIGFLEHSAAKMPSVMQAQEDEVWAEAEKEQLKARIRATDNVLQALQQEIADLRTEKSNPSYQEQH